MGEQEREVLKMSTMPIGSPVSSPPSVPISEPSPPCQPKPSFKANPPKKPEKFELQNKQETKKQPGAFRKIIAVPLSIIPGLGPMVMGANPLKCVGVMAGFTAIYGAASLLLARGMSSGGRASSIGGFVAAGAAALMWAGSMIKTFTMIFHKPHKPEAVKN